MTDKLQFWNEQAKEHGSSDLATAPDHYYRELEIEKIRRVIEAHKPKTVLDVGCGNGYSTIQFAKEFPDTYFVGVDFSDEMIAEAEKAYPPTLSTNYRWVKGDVLSLSRDPDLEGDKFEMVISTRCLINLDNWAEQKLGILEMRKMLVDGGHLVLVENTKDGLEKLNAIRASISLPEIKERWHNSYIPEQELATFLTGTQGHLFNLVYTENIGNMYYLASRVIYAKLAQDAGEEPSYDHPINKIASQLPTLGEHYACSPNFMFILQKIDGDQKWASNQKPS